MGRRYKTTATQAARPARLSPQQLVEEDYRQRHAYLGAHGRTKVAHGRIERSISHVNVTSTPECFSVAFTTAEMDESNPYAALLNSGDQAPRRCAEIFQSDIDDQQAQRLFTTRAATIKSNESNLRALMKTYGPKVTRTFTRRTPAKRMALLQAAMPDMPASQYWQLDAIHNSSWWQQAAKKRRRAWLVPYLARDNLSSDPELLIQLLAHRTHFYAEELFVEDLENLRFSLHAGALELAFSRKFVVMSGTQRGSVQACDADQAEPVQRMCVPLAMVVLEAQELLSEFLYKVASTILEDAGTVIQQDALASSCTSTPKSQSMPTKLSLRLSELHDLAKARFEEATDEIILAQTDIEYAHMIVQLSMASNIGRAHEATVRGGKWAAAATYLANTVLHRVKVWGFLAEECEQVLRNSGISIESTPPPKHLEDALACLDLLLSTSIEAQKAQLWERIARQPAFERYFVYDSQRQHLDLIFEAASENSKGTEASDKGAWMYRQDTLFYCLYQLSLDDEDPLSIPSELLHARLDSCLSDDAEKSRIDEALYRLLDDLAAMQDIHRIVRKYTVKAGQLTWSEAAERRPSSAFWRQCAPSHHGREPSEALGIFDQGNIGDVLKAFAECPLPSWDNDRQHYEQLVKKREKLAAFFAGARKNVAAVYRGRGFTPEAVDYHVQLLSQDLSPAYLKTVQNERLILENLLVWVRAEPAAVDETVFKDHDLDSQRPPDTPKTVENPKNKRKSRKGKSQRAAGITRHQERFVDAQPAPTRENVRGSQTVEVKESNLEILTAMLPSASGKRKVGGSARFDEVAAALVSAGMSMSQSKGSAVVFRLGRGGVQDQAKPLIIFHRPHPKPIVSWLLLRAMGKRLNMRFGWEAEHFVGKKR